MIRTIEPQLMFTGSAAEAMTVYVRAFDGAILEEHRYPPDHPTQAGQILRARLRLGTLTLACIDAPDVHDFTFTPSVSLFVELRSARELDALLDTLGAGGTVLMPVGDYGFSERFVWFNDRFGVSWQLNVQGGRAAAPPG